MPLVTMLKVMVQQHLPQACLMTRWDMAETRWKLWPQKTRLSWRLNLPLL